MILFIFTFILKLNDCGTITVITYYQWYTSEWTTPDVAFAFTIPAETAVTSMPEHKEKSQKTINAPVPELGTIPSQNKRVCVAS
jgi:hypothetical protein